MAILRIFIVPLAHLGLLPQYAGKVTSASVDKALACIDGNILAPRFSHVSLPGPADFLHRIRNHFAPLGNPAGCPGQRKQNREHRGCARLRRYPSGRTGRRYLWKPPRGGVFFVRLMPAFGQKRTLRGPKTSRWRDRGPTMHRECLLSARCRRYGFVCLRRCGT